MGVVPVGLAILLMLAGHSYGGAHHIGDLRKHAGQPRRRRNLHQQEGRRIHGRRSRKSSVAKMEPLKKMIFSVAVVSGILLLTSATIWAYIRLTRG